MISVWTIPKAGYGDNIMTKHLTLLLILVILLGACNMPGRNQDPITATVNESELTAPTDTPSPIPLTDTLPPPTETPEPIATDIPEAYGPDNFPADVNPLTGQKVSNPALLERRPLAVKVQIFPRGQRPPWGVALADIVYDYYQNNGLTRFHTIFLGTDAEQVGPIRSARLLDGQLINMYKSIFVFGGADSRILNRLYNAPYYDRLVVEGYGNCPPLCRVDPNGYNILMTNTTQLSEYATQKGIPNDRQNLDGMTFNSITPGGGGTGGQVIVRFSISSYNRWDFDPGSGRYLRFQDIQESQDFASQGYDALTDQLTNQQIAADNVVILFAAHKFVAGSKPGKSEIVDIKLDGTGQAIAFRDGQKYDLQWNRPESDSVLYLTFPDGTPYAYKPGNTWYQVIGESSSMETQEDGATRFHFAVP
jgi:hypothetical protein